MDMSLQKDFVPKFLAVGLLFVTVSFAEETPRKDDFRVAWLKQHAIPMRSIDPNDEDFTDLEPLVKIFKDIRIVQLGEQSHGDGTTFHAKTRLIKFLHQKLGFDVLAFESGLYDCRKAWELLRGGMEPYEAFNHGVWGIWTYSEQVKPLIDYWGRVAKSDKPLELCGFDCQFSGFATHPLLVKDVNVLWDKLGAAAPDDGQRAIISKAMPQMAKWLKPSQEERRQWHDALAALGKSLQAARPSDALPKDELVFWRQFVSSTSTLAAICGLGMKDENFMWWKLRDPQIARNLVWLSQGAYPHRRIIVWAHSGHLMRNPPLSWEDPGLRMGHEVWNVLGEKTYTVAFTSAEGNYARSGRVFKLDPPLPGSLEDLFLRAGCTNAFVDFRHLGPDGGWLKQKLSSRAVNHVYNEADWTNCFDGIAFIGKMFGSTRRSND